MKSLFASQKTRKSLFIILFLTFSVFSLTNIWQTAQTQTEPVALGEILYFLKLPNSTLEQRNKLLIEQVKKRGVTFPLTPEIEKELRDAGASNALIEIIRQKGPTPTPTPKTPTPTPTPKTPTPTPTPKPGPKQMKNSVGMEFVLIPAGSFMMGSHSNEKDRNPDEGPPRRVTIAYEFYLGKYEVTIGEWKSVMGDLPEGMKKNLDSKFMESDRQPVVRISWNDTQEFIARLNAKNDGYKYRLPSEAEWEYAARAGTQTRFYWGDDLNFSLLCKYANVKDFSDCPDNYPRNAPVGTYLPNSLGLYDMTGNVWEWCEDIWQNNYEYLPTDGSANLAVGDSGKRVRRGGSWADNPKYTRAAARNYDTPTDRNDEDGFRLVAVAK